MRNILLGAAAAAAIAALPAAAPAQKVGGATIVVVDTQRIGSECTACKAAQAQLQGQITSLQQRAQQLSTSLQAEERSLQTAVQALAGKQPDAALQARITAFQQKQQSAQQELAGREQTVNRNRAYVSQQVGAKLNPIINAVMTARGANLAVDQQATLTASPGLDVTNDVLAQLNQQLPSVSVTAPAAAAPARGAQGR